ncbi:Secondary metabolism regulator LAE1 [Colletotrichum fructicola Nara gc5]|uniref:Secondary metabolism regulator LAE1 n=2 Tax=Colletotrichum fructicola (strain Nara gc5) TaxID=1213859 RepID=A0A7J6JFD3_COLFN|nr:Secondary metabolism regulator LAE1 [Colletotrichum fructicola]KAF4488772.1 Secondary metabolism regulator LAE1 [Colletotrichum fructicola Nara gc5]
MSETREDTIGIVPAASTQPALAPADNTADANTADNNPAVSDDESARGESIASSSTSVTESVLEYRIENGRTYHKYKDGKYHLPNDERENERLDVQHNMWLLTFDNRLGTAPPNDPKSKVGRVLDVGTGTGIWVMEFGEEHPDAEVLGVDLSAIQPEFTPPNVKFQIDDIEEPWTYSQPFDYIHSRTMTFSVADWKEYTQKCYDNLSPNGYLELNEVDLWPKSDDETLKDDSAVLKFVRLWAEAAVMFGRPFQDIRVLKDIMIEIGFKDVYAQMFKWPTNSWPKDRKHRELGFWNHDNFCAGLEGFMMAPLTRAHNWTKEEVTVFGVEVRNDMRNKNIHAYSAVWSIYGRKPSDSEASK